MATRDKILVFSLAALSIAATESHDLAPLDGSLPRPSALVILDLTHDSPAAHAGLVMGDTLLSVDGWPLTSLDDLKHILLRRQGPSPARIMLGKPGGRSEVRVVPHGKPPKIGVLLTGVLVTPEMVQIDDDDGAVGASVSEWQGHTVIQVAAKNRGTRLMPFGPRSVAIVDGRGAALTPLPPESVIARVYGSEQDAAGASTADRRTREDAIRSLRRQALKRRRLRRHLPRTYRPRATVDRSNDAGGAGVHDAVCTSAETLTGGPRLPHLTNSASLRSRSLGLLPKSCRSQPRCPAPKMTSTRSLAGSASWTTLL